MILKPQISQHQNQDKNLTAICLKLDALIDALNGRPIPEALSEEINGRIQAIGSGPAFSGKLVKNLNSIYKEILRLIEKKFRWVPRNHHRNMWMPLGMSAFGLPVGLVLSTLLHNYVFIGIGLPIGMAIGIAVGTMIDRKVAIEGRQLDIE